MCTRPARLSTYVWYVCASSMALCLLGNLVLIRSDFERKPGDEGLDDFLSHSQDEDGHMRASEVDFNRNDIRQESGKSVFALDGGLVLERSLRKLMEDNNDVSKYDKLRTKSVTSEDILTFERTEGNTGGNLNIYLENTSIQQMLGCGDLHNIREVSYIASGWTKAVYRGNYKGRPVAVKTVDVSGQEVTTCVEKGFTLTQCYHKSTKKILKEIVLLQGLNHENVIKVLGYCIPDKPYTGEAETVVTMVTELGEPIDIIRLLQMWWEDRLRIAYDMTKVIGFLSKSPYGSLSMNDFRRPQFVLVEGSLKLSDVDDMGMAEPECRLDSDCDLFFFNDNLTLRTACSSKGRCSGFNEKKNVFNAGRHFTTFLLPHGAPKRLRPLIDKTVDGFGNVTMTTTELLTQMNKIVDIYRSGKYLNRTDTDDRTSAFKEYKNCDLPGQFDYRCKFSLSGSGCTISVFDRQEAEDICNTDPECNGFVISNQTTWTGRKIIHLKNGFGKPSRSKGTSLFARAG